MNEILQTHRPVALSDEQEKEIQRIIDKARSDYAKKGLL